MPEPADEPIPDVPVRRVSFTVTGYLRHGHPIGGHYDMQTQADGGMTYSIPDFQIDEDSVRDAAPERLSTDDWNEIRGHILARYGKEDGTRLLALWDRAVADMDTERAQAFQATRMPDPAAQLRARAEYFEATVKRVRALAISWSAGSDEHARVWQEASRILHETLDGPDDEEPER